MKYTFEQKVWLENFILNSNELRWQMINEARANGSNESKFMAALVLSHNLQELRAILLDNSNE